jgi:ATP-dependent RNA helicase DDX60
MFIMTDDGGSVPSDLQLHAERALIQRTFVYDLLTNGIAVALMRGAEFKDAKVVLVCSCLCQR